MASLQTMPPSLDKNAANAASASSSREADTTMKKGSGSGSISVAWLFMTACGAALVLRVLDKHLFCDAAEVEDDGGASELYFVAALVVGAVIFTHRRSSVWTGKMPCKMTPPSTTREPRQHADDMAFLPSRVDSALIAEIIEAGHKGLFGVAERHFGELMQSLGSAGDLPDELPSRSAASPSGTVADSLVEVCINAGDATRAASWMEALHASGLSCSPSTLRDVLDELSNGASTSEAEQLFTRMLAAGAEMDTGCYQLLFQRLAGDNASVVRHLQRIGRRGAQERVTGYVALIRACAVAGDLERAQHWMDHCITANMAKGDVQDGAAAQAPSSAQPSSPESAERLLREMLEARARPDEASFGAVVSALDKQGSGTGAERLMKLMMS